MKVAVICNGESAIKAPNGKFIDGCDSVIRVNKFVVQGYEKYIGSKIDICCAKWHKIPSDIDRANEIWFPHPEPPTTWHALGGSQQITVEDHNRNLNSKKLGNVNVNFLANKDRLLLDDHFKIGIPSIGIIAIQMALSRFSDPIYVTGFDFMMSGWYWDGSHNCTTNFRNCIPEEISYYRRLERNNRIITM